jgi:hypothetical protein
MAAPTLPALGVLVLLPLVAWRLYARFRRLVGRQRSSRIRPWITLTVFPAIILALGYAARGNAPVLAVLAGALAAGAVLGRYGLRRTRFEATAEGLFYTPHAPLGVALLALLAGRVIYRMYELSALSPAALRAASAAPSELTVALFGLLAGYYVAYAVGLLRWRRAVLRPVR